MSETTQYVMSKKSDLTSIADAVRSLIGSTDSMNLDSIKSNVNTAKTNIDDAFTALQDKGITVPSGAKCSELCGLIESITTNPPQMETDKAFAPLPAVDQSKTVILKRFVGIPSEFTYSYAYTNTANDLTATITSAAGDTIIAAIAIRKHTSQPDIPDGWDLITWVPAHPNDTGTIQSLLVVKKCAAEGNNTEITMHQVDAAQRLYIILCNIHDVTIGNMESSYVARTSTALAEVTLKFEHTLVIRSSELAFSDLSSPITTSNDTYSYNYSPDFRDGNSNCGGRLNLCYVPLLSEQITNTLAFSQILGDGDIFSNVLQLELIPTQLTRYVARTT